MQRPTIFLTAAAALFIASFVAANPTEDKAVAMLMKLGSKIVRDINKPGQPVVAVYLNGPKVNDAVMKDLAAFTQLRILDMRRTKVTDEGLKELATLTQLRELYLIGTGISNAGLPQLAHLKQLQKVYLIGAKVTDAGLKNLTGLKQLQELNVSDTVVTEAGIRQLQKSLPDCRVVR